MFVEYLKKDDGVLSSLLAAQSATGEEAALAQIEQYIKSVKQSVAETGFYAIEGLGRIYLTQGGIYELENGPVPVRKTAPAPQAPTVPPQPKVVEANEPVTKISTRQPSEKSPAAVHSAKSKPVYKPALTLNRPAAQAEASKAKRPAPPSGSRPAPGRPVGRKPAPVKKNRGDLVMIVAILAALLALAAIIFGVLVDSPAKNLRPVNMPVQQTEIPAGTVNPANE